VTRQIKIYEKKYRYPTGDTGIHYRPVNETDYTRLRFPLVKDMPLKVYHSVSGYLHEIRLSWFLIFWFASFTAGCVSPRVTQGSITVQIQSDGKSHSVQVPAGTTVQEALQQAGIIASNQDLTDPPPYTVLIDQSEISVTRVKEGFEVNDVVIPFERKTVRNESLPEGETLLIQPGINGLQEITYRRVFHDGVEVSNQEFKTSIVREAIPEIVMVGVQAPFSAAPIPGRLVYLTAGNAWLMDGSTGNRRPVVTSSDLDGYVFSLSPDGEWLLYTRKPVEPTEDTINSLWVVKIGDTPGQPIDLKASNIVHYAGWVPNSPLTIAYSTVEPRSTSPGWQANNNLILQTFSSSGFLPKAKTIIDANSGGIYGWWGTNFSWSPQGTFLSYSRPDGVGFVDLSSGELSPLLEITPYQTHSTWAWIPGIAWAPDASVLFTSNHLPSTGVETTEESPIFDLTAIPLEEGPVISLSPQTGMFVYPKPSPLLEDGNFLVAYLQAVFPETSDTSKYRLMVMDQDGSNPRMLFPAEDSPGFDLPKEVIWSPDLGPAGELFLAVIYQGNIWLVDALGKPAQQITGDGSITRVDWK